MTFTFVPNEAGMALLQQQVVETVLLQKAEELAQEIRALVPEEDAPGTGSALHTPGVMRDSIHVEVVDGVVCVFSSEWRFHLIEFGHVSYDVHVAGTHPFLRAVESWCSRNGWVLVPSGSTP